MRARLVVATVRRSKDWAGAKQRVAARRAAQAAAAAAADPASARATESGALGGGGGIGGQEKETARDGEDATQAESPDKDSDGGGRTTREKRATTEEGRGEGFYSEVVRRMKRQKVEDDGKCGRSTHVWQMVHIAPAKRSLMRKLDEMAEGDG